MAGTTTHKLEVSLIEDANGQFNVRVASANHGTAALFASPVREGKPVDTREAALDQLPALVAHLYRERRPAPDYDD